MDSSHIIYDLVLIYVGTALLSTCFLFLKQPIILSYIILGMLIGPYGAGFISNADRLEQISHFGIILLLFLIGLNLHPNKLYQLFRKTFVITITTCLLFAAIASSITFLFQFPLIDSLVVGVALMFSSTVVSLKLIPTSDLHHERIGEIMLSVLLLQDIFAIIVILLVGGNQTQEINMFLPLLFVKLVLLLLTALAFAKYCLLWIFNKFSAVQEYIFVISLGWCLLIAETAMQLGLSYEIGAFIAGISIAISPIALVISEHLKSLREFFLILFFFAVGAQFDLLISQYVLIPGLTICLTLLALKPLIYQYAFQYFGEKKKVANELALRLGQTSEFALLIAYTAVANNIILELTSYLIQVIVMLGFILSTYLVVFLYPTPISSNAQQRRD